MSDIGEILTSDGYRIAWQSDGPFGAPPLILSNSLGSNMEIWVHQFPALSQQFRVVRYDHRGHGLSAVPAGEASLDRLGLDVVELLNALEIERAHFCGVSLGGMVGQWLGVNAPDRMDRMVLSCTSSYLGPPSAWQQRIDAVLGHGMKAIADAVASRWVTPAFTRKQPDHFANLRAMVLATDPVGYAACCAAIRDMDLRASVGIINRSVLVISATEDPATPTAMGEELAAAISDAEFALLPGAHLTNFENAAAFNSLVLRFLSEASSL